MFNWWRTRKAQTFDLPQAFKAKIGQFRHLLAANNKILETMAEMAGHLDSGAPVSLALVQRLTTTLTLEAHRLVRALNAMSGDRFTELNDLLTKLSFRMAGLLKPAVRSVEGPPVLPLAALGRGDKEMVGAKMANLAEVRNRLRLKVPDGFAVTVQAEALLWAKSGLREEIHRRLQTADGSDLSRLAEVSASIQGLLNEAPLPPELEAALGSELLALAGRSGGDLRVALRSSAVGEDEGETSFAGQFLSVLNLAPENVAADYKRVLASRYGLQALIYREQMGLRDEDAPMAVGCLAMVPAVASGIVYTRNPDSPQAEETVITAVWGLGRYAVDGRVQPQTLILPRDLSGSAEEWRVSLGAQDKELKCAPGEGCVPARIPPERRTRPCLTEAQARELARQALLMERHFGEPQDVEWALDEAGELVILQARPLRTTPAAVTQAASEWLPPAGVEPLLLGGAPASRGVAHGRVYLTRNLVDMLSFPQGAVLVSGAAHSQWAALAPKAAALVCDQGGVASHLATVAREFGKPALFKTGTATKVLTQDQMVTVDAVGGAVYPGIVQELLARSQAPRRSIKGSPVHHLLKAVYELVGPLNLVDPQGDEFNPRGCRTIHDITRFCHEAALKEMFHLSPVGPESLKGAVRLEAGLPVEALLIDLGGALAPGSGAKLIALNQVLSRPAKALLAGLKHPELKWSGAVKSDLKGFMGVVVRSAAGDGGILDDEGRMYFLAAHDYLNFSSRLAYHFANIDCLMGPEENSNYITFRLGGGGASPERRARRIRFLARVLREYYFVVETKGDVLTARLNMVVEEFVAQTLEALGRLIVCARQADLAMASEDDPGRYARAFLDQDYAFFFGGP